MRRAHTIGLLAVSSMLLGAMPTRAAVPSSWFGAVIDAPGPAAAGLRGPGCAVLRSLGDLHLVQLTDAGLARIRPHVGQSGIRRIVMVDRPQLAEPLEAPGGSNKGRGETGPSQDPFDRHGLSGRGVLVGVIDSGLDVRHPAFLDAQGQTRVLEAWDQTVPASAAAAVGAAAPPVSDRTEAWGCSLDRAAVQRLLPLAQPPVLVDEQGHGTAATGTAAGTAVGEHPAGIAPGAELLVVKTASGAESPVMNYLVGLCWLADRAAQLHRPCVVNMSFTGLNSAASGLAQELVIRAIAQRYPRGLVLVAAAGNDGDSAKHARGRLDLGGAPQTIGLQTRPGATVAVVLSPARGCQIEVLGNARDTGSTAPQPLTMSWAALPNGEQKLAVRGSSLSRSFKQAVWDKLQTQVEAAALGRGRTLLTWTLPAQVEGRQDLRLTLLGDGPNTTADWELWVTNGGTVCEGGDQLNCVGYPARCREVLAVGAYDHNCKVQTADGWVELPTPDAARPDLVWQLNQPSYFSSRGFCVGEQPGEVKPDLLAPGQWVTSPLAQVGAQPSLLGQDHGQPARRRLSTDGRYVAWHGTSAAAPYVTGLVALLLEARPQWGLADVSLALRTMLPPQPADSQWGRGRLEPELVGAALAKLGK